jgi:hypothetical protein
MMQRIPWRSLATVLLLLATVIIGVENANGQVVFKSPQPGDVYKEYMVWNDYHENNWRVTDPNISLTAFPDVAPFLPNPTLSVTLDDLTDATRAEVLIAEWGGHVGTTNRTLAFNGNTALTIPELASINGIPDGHQGQCYMSEPMVGIDVPLSHLRAGTNTFRASSGGQTCYGWGWGQWGMYGLVIRVYYDPAKKAHPTGTITSPLSGGTISDNPVVAASVSAGVNRVDFLAYYDDYSTDGVGVYQEYHHDYHFAKDEGSVSIKNHVGTATSAPWQTTWNTTWVQDQSLGGVKIHARLRDGSGVWYVTPEAANVSIVRVGKSVKMYKAQGVPEEFWAQGYSSGDSPISCTATIPSADGLGSATGALLHLRTWNGNNEKFYSEPGRMEHYARVNSYTLPEASYGSGHFYSYDRVSIPTGSLVSGTNTFSFFANTQKEHGIEISWPGPALSIAYAGSYSSPQALSPALVSPLDNAPTAPMSPTLVWNKALIATGYRLQISTDAGFSTPVVDDSTITDTLKQVGPLASQTRYYWRVRTMSATGGSAFSAARNFTTFVGAPVHVAPANGGTGIAMSARLSWAKVSSAIGYYVQVATDQAFASGIVLNDSTVTDTTVTLSGLSNSTKYYWRVKTRVTGGSSGFSTPWNFTTVQAPAAVPVPLAPANSATNQQLSLTLVWRSAANAASYAVQVATDSTFVNGVVLNESGLTDTTKAVSGLAYDTQYYWHVSASNGAGTTAFSSTWRFRTVMSVAGAPVQVSPSNGAMNQDMMGLVLRWRTLSGATQYRLQVGTDSTFASGLFKDDSTLTDTVRTLNALTISTKYFWRVRGKNAGGPGPYSPTWKFTTIIPLPTQVALISPALSATVSRDSAQFVWNRTTPASTRFWFEISVDPAFSMFTSVDSTLTDTSKIFKPLMNAATYYWRVRGGNAGGWGPFSETGNFKVVITSVTEDRGIPTDFVLRQNYPNPFNPETSIEFGLPRETRVTVIVYNVLGEAVETLVDEVEPAGNHVVRFNAEHFPSGIYLYKMNAGSVSLMRKMILLR